MLAIHTDLSIVSLITFKRNRMELTTASFLLVFLIFHRRLYWWIYHTIPKMKNFPNVSKFDVFTDNKYDIRIKWITKKVKQLFKLNSRNPHPSCVIYEGVCSCQESYIGETVRNVEIRWQEHEDTQKDSEAAKDLKNNPTHSCTLKVLLPVSSIR